VLEGLHLVAVADASVDDRDAEIRETGEFPEGLFDLGGELAGGFKDESMRAVRLRIAEFGDDGQTESGSLAGPGLSAANDILALENEGNGPGLDGRWFFKTLLLNGTYHRFRETQFRKRHAGMYAYEDKN
jgi:hypothetical protein